MNNKRNVRVKRVFFIVCLNLLSKKFGTIQPDIRPKEDKNYEYRSNVFQNRFLKCGPYNSLQSIRITMGITKKYCWHFLTHLKIRMREESNSSHQNYLHIHLTSDFQFSCLCHLNSVVTLHSKWLEIWWYWSLSTMDFDT